MKRWLAHILRLCLALGLVVGVAMAQVSCGGGSSAAPGGTGGDVVTVEIPALQNVGGLPFASAVVVAGSGNIAAALKATPTSWVYKSFTLIDSNAFTTGDSRQACEYRNMASVLVGTWAMPDQALCSIKNNVSSFTSPYDGNYHILATGVQLAGVPSKIKFKLTKNSSGVITNYEEFTCDSTNTQLTYVTYTITNGAMTASLKTIGTSQPQYQQIDLTATLNASAQYTAKSGTVVYTGTMDSGALQGKINATQGVSTLLLNGFDSRGSGSNVVRIYGQADQSNTTSPLAISGYTYGAGASVLNDNGTASTGCWDTNNDPTTCSGANYTAVNGQTPMTASTQTVSSFSGSTAWDCSGTVEATSTESYSSASSCYNLFSLSSSHIDCVTATQGYLTVTPSVSSTTLSTRSDMATSVSTTPTILITGSRAFDTESLNSTTVTLVNNSNNESVSLSYNNWNSGTTVLTLSPTLTAGVTYKLTLVGSSTTASSGTVIRAPGATPPADQLQSTGTYYITAR